MSYLPVLVLLIRKEKPAFDNARRSSVVVRPLTTSACVPFDVPSSTARLRGSVPRFATATSGSVHNPGFRARSPARHCHHRVSAASCSSLSSPGQCGLLLVTAIAGSVRPPARHCHLRSVRPLFRLAGSVPGSSPFDSPPTCGFGSRVLALRFAPRFHLRRVLGSRSRSCCSP